MLLRQSPTEFTPVGSTVAPMPNRWRNAADVGLRCGLLFAVLVPVLAGCASLTNPVAHGVPVRRLDPKFLARSREAMVPLPLNLLQREIAEDQVILPDAVLGVFIDNVLGSKDTPPPVTSIPDSGGLPPSIGFPVLVRRDGTISLPFAEPIEVKGLTATQAEKKIRETLMEKGIITKQNRCIVTLQRQNLNRVLVVRQDSGGVNFGSDGLNNTKRGTGFTLELPESDSDVATALTRTGGMPGLDAYNEVFVLRPISDKKNAFPANMPDLRAIARDPTGQQAKSFGYSLIRIPLRMLPGEELPFRREDVTLRTGDILYIDARDTELFFVGGIIPPKQVVLPRDYDLDVLEAMALTGAPFFNGGFGASNFTGNFIQNGLGQPSPTDLAVIRRVPGVGEVTIRVDLALAVKDPRERLIIMPGDVLILQETIGEASIRYLTQVVNLSAFFSILSTPSGSITGSGRFP